MSMPLRIAVFLLSTLVVAGCSKGEYSGEFSTDLDGTFITADPRPLFRLARDFEFLAPNGLTWSPCRQEGGWRLDTSVVLVIHRRAVFR